MVTVRRCNLIENRIGANYFILAKVMQANDKEAVQKEFKLRTDVSISAHSGQPQFIQNILKFDGIDSSGTSRTSIEFMLYMAP